MACTVVYCVTAFVWATVTVLTTSVVVVACACTVSGTPCVVVFVFVGIGRHEQALEIAAKESWVLHEVLVPPYSWLSGSRAIARRAGARAP
jgi:hypothetical protein